MSDDYTKEEADVLSSWHARAVCHLHEYIAFLEANPVVAAANPGQVDGARAHLCRLLDHGWRAAPVLEPGACFALIRYRQQFPEP